MGIDSNIPVSSGLASYGAAATNLAFFSVLAAVSVRIAMSCHESIPKGSLQLFSKRLLQPLVLLSFFPTVISVFLLIFVYYWAGWVSFPSSYVQRNSWVWAGAAFMLASILLVLYLLLLASLLIVMRGKPVGVGASACE